MRRSVCEGVVRTCGHGRTAACASPVVGEDGRVNDLLYIDGGNPLRGEITVRGAKNFVSKAMVAALLGETPSVLRNVPQIRTSRW